MPARERLTKQAALQIGLEFIDQFPEPRKVGLQPGFQFEGTAVDLGLGVTGRERDPRRDVPRVRQVELDRVDVHVRARSGKAIETKYLFFAHI